MGAFRIFSRFAELLDVQVTRAAAVWLRLDPDGTVSERTTAQLAADLNLSGTNSGDQTSITGITGTMSQFDAAASDGNFVWSGTAPALTGTNFSGTGASFTAGAVTNLGNLTGAITSVDRVTSIGAPLQAELDGKARLNGTNAFIGAQTVQGNFSTTTGGNITASGDFLSATGNLTLTSGNVSAGGTVTGSNLSGTNTGDQASIVGITGTMAQFDSAVSDGNIIWQGGAASVTTLAVSGNTTLGDATGDTITFTGRAASHLQFTTDNTYDLGASGANRPRHVYAAGDVRGTDFHLNGSGEYNFSGGSARISYGGGDGRIEFRNSARNGFTRLQFGGSTTSFAGMSFSGTSTTVGRADGSAGGSFTASGTFTATGASTLSTLVISPAASATPATNGQLTFEATSDTSLTIKLKGTDGTVRSVVLTLAP